MSSEYATRREVVEAVREQPNPKIDWSTATVVGIEFNDGKESYERFLMEPSTLHCASLLYGYAKTNPTRTLIYGTDLLRMMGIEKPSKKKYVPLLEQLAGIINTLTHITFWEPYGEHQKRLRHMVRGFMHCYYNFKKDGSRGEICEFIINLHVQEGEDVFDAMPLFDVLAKLNGYVKDGAKVVEE